MKECTLSVSSSVYFTLVQELFTTGFFFSENLFYSVNAIFYGFQFMVCYLALVSPDFFWGDSPLLSII